MIPPKLTRNEERRETTLFDQNGEPVVTIPDYHVVEVGGMRKAFAPYIADLKRRVAKAGPEQQGE